MASCVLELLSDFTGDEFEEIGTNQRLLRSPYGYVIIEEFYPHLRIIGVWREPAHGGQGYGRRMIEAVREYCRTEGLQPIACNVIREYVPFWESLDFVSDPHNPCDFILAGYAEAA